MNKLNQNEVSLINRFTSYYSVFRKDNNTTKKHITINKKLKMNWTTLYIQGKSGFDADVLKNLEHSTLNFLHGTSLESGICLYWVDEKVDLRDIKLAIGSKIVFKYRLRFYTTIEEMIESQPDLTDISSESSLEVYA